MLINCDLGKIKHENMKVNIQACIKNILDKIPLKSLFGEKEYKYANKILKQLYRNFFTLNGNGFEWNKNDHSILVGGTLVSRGYTFEKLLTTVLLNEPQSEIAADTLLQRARWFGYRREIVKFMKVYLSKKIYDSFAEANVLVEYFSQDKISNLDQNVIKNN